MPALIDATPAGVALGATTGVALGVTVGIGVVG
jgi:hypothetical protein